MQAHAYNSHSNGLTVERVHAAGSSGEEDKGCGGARRGKEGPLVVAGPEPRRKWKSSPVGKNTSCSFWTRREEVKVLQNWDRWTHQEGKRAFLLDTHPDKHQAQPPCFVATRYPSHCAFPGDGVRRGLPATWVGEMVIVSSLGMGQKPGMAGKKGEASKVTSIMADTLLPLALLRKGTKFPRDCQLPLARCGWSRLGSVRRTCVTPNCPWRLPSLLGLQNNHR